MIRALLVVLVIAGSLGCATGSPAVRVVNPESVLARPGATIQEKIAALKVAVEQVRALKISIQRDRDSALQRKFYWLIAGFGLLALLFGAAAWFLPLFRKISLEGVAFCVGAACVLGVLARLVPHFHTIATISTLALLAAGAGWLFFRSKQYHNHILASQPPVLI